MTRLLASTLVLAGAAWATSGAWPSDQAIRQASARLETAGNPHNGKALASRAAERAEANALAFLAGFLRMGAMQTRFLGSSVSAFQLEFGQSADASLHVTPPARVAGIPLVVASQNGLWLLASAHNPSLLANPPPR